MQYTQNAYIYFFIIMFEYFRLYKGNRVLNVLSFEFPSVTERSSFNNALCIAI